MESVLGCGCGGACALFEELCNGCGFAALTCVLAFFFEGMVKNYRPELSGWVKGRLTKAGRRFTLLRSASKSLLPLAGYDKLGNDGGQD